MRAARLPLDDPVAAAVRSTPTVLSDRALRSRPVGSGGCGIVPIGPGEPKESAMSHRAGSLVAPTAVLAIAVLATAGRVHAAALTPQEEKLVAVNVIEGEVIDTVCLGSFLDGQVRAGAHAISVLIDHYERLVPGQKVFLTFEPEHGLCLSS